MNATNCPAARLPPPASGRGSARRGRSSARLQVAACHRCLLDRRQRGPPLLPPLQQLQSCSRGPGASAALKDGSQQADQQEQQQQGQQAAPGEQSGAAPPAPGAEQPQEQEQDSPGVAAALAMLRFYKAAISPLLPPACRFLPTCSAYSMDAYKRYGVAKGTVLTAWRLLRCTPWGNSGYDPVAWPPPGLERLFKQ